MIKTKVENLMKMGGVIALLATTLAISDSATALNLTIGNSANTTVLSNGTNAFGQSFINDTNGSASPILLNDWTFMVSDFMPPFTNNPISGLVTLSIYAGTGIGGTLIGSTTTYTTAGSGNSSTATWTFAGGLSLIDNQTYTAAVSSSLTSLNFRTSSANPYANGILTRSNSGDLTGSDTVFTANFSAGATAVPFEFETTSGLAILGGAWLLRRHLKNRTKKA